RPSPAGTHASAGLPCPEAAGRRAAAGRSRPARPRRSRPGRRSRARPWPSRRGAGRRGRSSVPRRYDNEMHDAAWINANLATMRTGSPYGTILDGAVAVKDGSISWVGPRGEWRGSAREEHDARGAWITPGLVDCHTHLVYAGNRAQEFELRLEGASYEEIARAGGGIVSTVMATRAASEQELFDSGKKRIDRWLAEGACAIEIKSGYGLDRDTELRMLRVARRLGEAMTVKTTFLGAHALPPEYAGRADDYIDFVCDEVLPAAAKEGLVDAVDAFCERIAFDVSQTRRVFEKAR